MAAESFFGKIAKEVIQATEHIATRMEEGLSVLTTGELPKHYQENSNDRGSRSYNKAPPPSLSLPLDLDLDEFNFEDLTEEEMQKLLSEEMMKNSPLSGIADSVLGDIMAGQIGPSTPMEHFHAFRSAIRWTEPFILCLATFQFFMFIVCLWASRKDRGTASRLVVLLTVAIVVRSAERLNEWGAENWESFATQNYFDQRGVFIGIMLCGPLLLDCLVMLFLFLREASQLLVQVKKQEMTQKKKESQQQKEKGSGDNKKVKRANKARKED